MNIKIELKNNEFCEWCPFLIDKQEEQEIKKWFGSIKQVYELLDYCLLYKQQVNNEGKGAIRLDRCLEENI